MSCCGFDLLGLDEIGGDPAPSVEDVRAGRGVLKKGMSGDSILYVQTMTGMEDLSGDFDDATDAAVRKFQSAKGLKPVDGIVGKITIAALDKVATSKNLPAAAPAAAVDRIIEKTAEYGPFLPTPAPTPAKTPAAAAFNKAQNALITSSGQPSSDTKPDNRGTYIALLLGALGLGGIVWAGMRH